jgi:hypothetical protein
VWTLTTTLSEMKARGTVHASGNPRPSNTSQYNTLCYNNRGKKVRNGHQESPGLQRCLNEIPHVIIAQVGTPRTSLVPGPKRGPFKHQMSHSPKQEARDALQGFLPPDMSQSSSTSYNHPDEKYNTRIQEPRRPFTLSH